jgi:hypothetical protein
MFTLICYRWIFYLQIHGQILAVEKNLVGNFYYVVNKKKFTDGITDGQYMPKNNTHFTPLVILLESDFVKGSFSYLSFNRIFTSLAILSVLMPRYCMVYFFKSHCNCIGNCICKSLHVIALFGFFYSFYSDCDSLDIYRWYIFVGAYRWS